MITDAMTGGMRPVASYAPNPFGLYDLVGNANEWCWDSGCDVIGCDATGRVNGRVDYRGTGDPTAQRRIVRGGAYDSGTDRYEASYRDSDMVGESVGLVSIGFRCVVRVLMP